MEDLLTTRQLQDLLKVDRITIYRMLQDGRLKGVKIGTQWRFPRRDVDRLLQNGPIAEATPPPPAADATFPVHCIQTVQDLFAGVGQVSAIMVDREGEPVTVVSQPAAIFTLIQSTEAGQIACQKFWRRAASQSGAAGLRHAGFAFLTAPVRDNDQSVGVFIVGPMLPPAEATPEARQARVEELAVRYGLSIEEAAAAEAQAPVVDVSEGSDASRWPATAVRAVESILLERRNFLNRLQLIANLTQVS